MILLRRVIGDALRARRQSQHRTLREVSTAANVSLGYLSEIERGQKEASSELLAAICDALGAQLSELLREASHTVAAAERVTTAASHTRTATPHELVGAGARMVAPGGDGAEYAAPTAPVPPGIVLPAGANARATRRLTVDGEVAVSVHQNGPLKATLRTTRNARAHRRGSDVVCVV
jgi:hypothetical protein